MTTDQQKQLKEGLLNLCNKIEQVHNFAMEDKPAAFTNALVDLVQYSRIISADVELLNPPSKLRIVEPD